MPNYVRWREEGARYFFTVVTFRRRHLFSQPLARTLLRQSMNEVRARFPFEMFACVLLPDHLHCLWALPEHDDNFTARWASIKRLFTQKYLRAGGRSLPVSESRKDHHERGVWQPRFWEHCIRNEEDWYRHRDYIHLNPVNHGYVQEPGQWPWSSFHRHVQCGWLDPEWPGASPIELIEVAGE